MIVFSRNPSWSNAEITRPMFQSTHEIEAIYARITSLASVALAARLMNRSALRGRMAALGKPGGTVGHAAKSGGRVSFVGSHMSKYFCGASGGLCGLENPQPMNQGLLGSAATWLSI